MRKFILSLGESAHFRYRKIAFALAWGLAMVPVIPAYSAPPGLLVEQASKANVKRGQIVKVGEIVRTDPFTVRNGRTQQGGNATLSFDSWGIAKIDMLPGSSVVLTEYGQCYGGGRTVQLDVQNEVYITTRPKTHRCSETIVCYFGSQGCVSLNSSVRLAGLDTEGKFIVSVGEGCVVAKKRLDNKPILAVRQRQYSIATSDGVFSPPQSVDNPTITTVTQTKSVRVLRAPEGFTLSAGKVSGQTIQIPKNLGYFIKNPLGEIIYRDR
jgi:hypothetical protein